MTRSKNTYEDDRTEEQVKTLGNIVVGKDKFLSGWGEAEDAISFAGWACSDEDVERVLEWVSNRSDMEHVEVVDDFWLPKCPKWHYHVYVVEAGHPALNKNESEV